MAIVRNTDDTDEIDEHGFGTQYISVQILLIRVIRVLQKVLVKAEGFEISY